MKYGFGVDLGGTTIKIAFFDETGTMLTKWEIPTVRDNAGEQILPDIAKAVLDFMAERNLAKEDILGIGIGAPGSIDPEGWIDGADNLGWGKLHIPSILEKLSGLRVVAGNDATVAALGECWKGGGKNCQNMFFVTLGTGVGGGLVVNGKVVHGTTGAAGEVGHMVINRNETKVCGCGKRGCVEQYCSATGIVRITKEYLQADTTPSRMRQIENLTCKDVFDCANEGDKIAQAALEQVYAYMGEFIANVCTIINPEEVVIGGGVSKAGQPLLDGIQRYFGRYIYHASTKVTFKLASLGNDAGAYGAFKLLLD